MLPLQQSTKNALQYFIDSETTISAELNTLLTNPQSLNYSLADVIVFKQLCEVYIGFLRNPQSDTVPSGTSVIDRLYANLVAATTTPPTTVAGDPGVITLETLMMLKVRIEQEVARLTALRSSDATLLKRIAVLTQLGADVSDIISEVQRSTLALKDVPITPDSATAFLASLESNTAPVPPLMEAVGAPPPSGGTPTTGAPDTAAIQELLAATKNLKWSMDVRLEYDPKFAYRERMMTRLTEIMNKLTSLAVSETPLPPKIYDQYLFEIQAIQRALNDTPPQPAAGSAMGRIGTAGTRVGSGVEWPSNAAADAAAGADGGDSLAAFPAAGDSADAMLRPGFVMNDDQIARRGSAASYEGGAVAGADYKARSLELCRQIKSAGLGDTASFGCIANPDEVGPTYSWRGNYLMVCNRLGDSWGRNYPEQFGCPAYDATFKFGSGF